MTAEYVKNLVAAHPNIKEVWLIGSRADRTNLATSDWDYIAVADLRTLDALEKDDDLNSGNIDLLVVFDGDNFRKPWIGDKQKSGSLSDWKWRRVSDLAATYKATKVGSGDAMCCWTKQGHGRRVYP